MNNKARAPPDKNEFLIYSYADFFHRCNVGRSQPCMAVENSEAVTRVNLLLLFADRLFAQRNEVWSTHLSLCMNIPKRLGTLRNAPNLLREPRGMDSELLTASRGCSTMVRQGFIESITAAVSKMDSGGKEKNEKALTLQKVTRLFMSLLGVRESSKSRDRLSARKKKT